MDYKTLIDKYIEEMKKEYDSTHDNTTKALILEYYRGKLDGIYEVAESLLSESRYYTLCEYRWKERNTIALKIYQEYIEPIRKES